MMNEQLIFGTTAYEIRKHLTLEGFFLIKNDKFIFNNENGVEQSKFSEEEYKIAIENYKKYIDLNPNSEWFIYAVLSSSLIKTQKYDEALYYIDKGLLLTLNEDIFKPDFDNSNLIFFFYFLAIIYYIKKDYNNAFLYSRKIAFTNCNELIDYIYKYSIYNIKDIRRNEIELAFTEKDYKLGLSLHYDYIKMNFDLPPNIQIFDYDFCYPPYAKINIHECILLSILEIKNIKDLINESNPIFKRLDCIKESCDKKLKEKIELTKQEKDVSHLKVYHDDERINFGKYSGSYLYKINPNYIIWCIINLDHFSILSSELTGFFYRENPQLKKALEINLIKELIIEKWKDDKPMDFSNFKPDKDYRDDDYYNRDSNYCGACQESPCMCSDPERTSTLW